MSENTTSAGLELPEAVEELLRQLVDARFVLTDREGSVTRWSRPAEELFGWSGGRMLGRPLFATLAVPDEHRDLGGEFEVVAHRRDGSELEVALTMVPVRMSESLEFNSFLEALEIGAPRGDALLRLQQSHRAVVDWIASALAGEAELDPDELTAGTIVAFRPLGEHLPPDPAGRAQRVMDAAALADAGQMTDAMEVVFERSDDLEQALQGTTVEVEQARREAAAARAEAAEAGARVAALEELSGRLGSELEDARGVVEEMRERVETLRSELRDARVTSEERAHAEQEQTAGAVDEARTLVEGIRAELAEMPQEQARLGSELEGTRAKLAAMEQALADERSRGEHVARLDDELQQIRSLVGGVEEATGTQEQLGRELHATRELVQALNERIEEIQVAGVEDEDARHLLDDLREEMTTLRALAAGGSPEDGAELQQLVQDAQAIAAAASDSAEKAGSALAAVEQLAARSGEAVEAAQASSSSASDAADAAGTGASRAEQAAMEARSSSADAGEAAGAARSEATSAADAVKATAAQAEEAAATAARVGETAARVEAVLARVEEAAGTAEAHGARATDASSAAELHLATAVEAARSAELNAAHAAEHSRRAEDRARALERAGLATEPQAKRAEDAAVAAEESAESAWNAVRAVLERSGEVRAARLEPDPADRAGANGASFAGERADPHRPLFGRKSLDLPMREPLPGFDDAPNPMATIGLDGHFRDLNVPFSELVGYAEQDFRAALWPPVMDRRNLPKHREEMTRMLAGEIDSAEVNTGYVHAQGLLVPVVGRISMVRENGEPSHFLLEVDAT